MESQPDNQALVASRLSTVYAQRLHEVLSDAPLVASNRNEVAFALLDASIEHFRGMVCLVGEGIYGSAFALLRPQYEALVRGAWLAHTATADDVGRFRNNESFEFPKLHVMLEQMEAQSLGFVEHLAGIKRRNYKRMNDLTHGGRLQAAVRCGEGEIGQRIPDKDAADLLAMAAAMAAAAAAVIFDIGDRVSSDRSATVKAHLDVLLHQLRSPVS